MRLHLQLWRSHQPEIIVIQEATLACLRGLLNDSPDSLWLRENYWSSATLESPAHWHSLVIFSQVRPQQVEMLQLPSKMGRRLLLVSFHNLQLGVVHLESTFSAGPMRISQMQHIQSLWSMPNVVWLGDFNFCHSSPENSQLPGEFTDLWPTLHPNEPGWTVDAERNKSQARPSTACLQKRIDRIFLRGPNWQPESIELVGTTPHQEVWPSDHFGLLARLRRSD